MNFKKFISGVSALTIAASAFAGMAVTANAEATTAFSQDFTAITPEGASEASTDPADYGFTDIGTLTKSGSATVTNGVFAIVAGNNGSQRGFEYAANFTPIPSGNEVTVRYKWAMGNATGNNTQSYVETYLADESGNKALDIVYYGQGYKLNINGTDVSTSFSRNQTLDVSATLDLTRKKVTSLSLGNAYTAPSEISFASASAESISRFGFTHSARASSWTNTSSIDNVVISYEALETTTLIPVTFTEGNSVSATVTVNGNVITNGDLFEPGSYSFTAAAEGYYNYEGTFTVDEDDESVNVPYTMSAKTAVAIPVVATAGGTPIKTYDTINTYVGEGYSFAPYAYILYNGEYYEYDSINDNGSVDTISGTAAADTEITLSYAKAENVVYYAEAETATRTSGHSNGYAGNSSLASGGYQAGAVYGEEGAGNKITGINIAKSGTYKVSANTVGTPSGNRSCYLAFDNMSTHLATLRSEGDPGMATANVHLDAGTHDFYWVGTGANSCYVDYMVLELVSVDPTAEASLVNGNVGDDTGYEGEDAGKTFSVYEATVTAGTNAITNVLFTLNDGEMTTDTWSNGIMTSGNAVFALIVPMASTEVTDITAVIDNVPYVAFN